MIKANELRIGNLVNYWRSGRCVEQIVDNITQFGINFEDSDPNSVDYFESLTGIPLTPEILLKAGAINNGNVFFIGKLKFTYEINELSQFVRFHYSGKVTYLQYLHELQNLYYAICRNEIDITL